MYKIYFKVFALLTLLNIGVVSQTPTSQVEMTFTYNYDSRLRVYRSWYPQFFRWIWFEFDTDSTLMLNWVEYNPTQTLKRKKIMSPSKPLGSKFLAFSPSLDCTVIATGTSFNILKFFPSNPDFDIVSYTFYQTLSQDISSRILSLMLSSNIPDQPSIRSRYDVTKDTESVQVGDQCWAFKVYDEVSTANTFEIKNLVYVKSQSTGSFVKSTVSSTQFANAVFDNSLKFVLVPGTNGTAKIYKFGTTDYVNIFNITGLKSTTTIQSSRDSNKLLIVSKPYPITSFPYTFAIQVYVSDGTNFAPVTFSNNGEFNTTLTTPVYFDPSFQTIVVESEKTRSISGKTRILHCMKVNFNTRTVSFYEIHPSLLDGAPGFYIEGEIMQFIDTSSIASTFKYYRYLLRLDKTNLKITQVAKVEFDYPFAAAQKGYNITLANGVVKILEDTEPRNGNIELLKIELDSPTPSNPQTPSNTTQNTTQNSTLQIIMRNIQIQQGGLVISNGEILLCPLGCMTCSTPSSCQSCSRGYVLKSSLSLCVRCGSLCATCLENSPDICATCLDGYFITGTANLASCLRCSDTCITCTSTATTCTSCLVGSFLDGTSCTQCMANCISCTTSTTCATCKPGFVYHAPSSACVKCISGCAICNPTQIYSCVSCGSGFEPAIINNTISSCQPCPSRCKICSNGNCTECRPGFRLLNNYCADQCIIPCKECSLTQADFCTSCFSGYSLTEGKSCTPDLTCNLNKSCMSCPIGFNLNAGQCKTCNGGENCRACDTFDINKCASCNRGFYLTNTSTCATCDIFGCAACESPAYCRECKPGFISAASGSSKCIRCASQCATCFQSPNNCDLCAAGFTKRGWNCVSNTNIQLFLSIAVSLLGFTTADFSALEELIANVTGKEKWQILIDKVKEGSINVDATISTNNMNQQRQLMDILQTQLTKTTNIGGYQISYSLQSNGDISAIKDDSEAMRYRNIAIIVGIVIPFLLIFIFAVILVFIYKKMKGMAHSSLDDSRRIHDATSEIQIAEK